MTNMHRAIPEEKLTEAYRLLLEMRDNCVKHADDQYDDPKREAKREALNIAITAMGRSVQPRWISVKERLPGDEKPVLVYYGFWRKENAGTALRYTGTLSYFRFDPQPHWQHESTGLIVTHWMPLPEPPKEEV